MDNLTFLISLLTFSLVWGLYSRNIDQQHRSAISRLEAKLDLLLKNAGLDYDPYADLPPSVVDSLRKGEKIEAIKRYREATGADLKTAKEFIEEAQRRSPLGA
ncbi:MAG: hypothetical protein ACLQGP_22510 [Isosphaeraceae bacterium]